MVALYNRNDATVSNPATLNEMAKDPGYSIAFLGAKIFATDDYYEILGAFNYGENLNAGKDFKTDEKSAELQSGDIVLIRIARKDYKSGRKTIIQSPADKLICSVLDKSGIDGDSIYRANFKLKHSDTASQAQLKAIETGIDPIKNKKLSDAEIQLKIEDFVWLEKLEDLSILGDVAEQLQSAKIKESSGASWGSRSQSALEILEDKSRFLLQQSAKFETFAANPPTDLATLFTVIANLDDESSEKHALVMLIQFCK